MNKPNPPQITTRKYKVLGIELNVAKAGKGEPLVFIHGWSNSWIGWTPLIAELAPYNTLYLVDLPGFGDSDSLPSYSLEIINKYLSEFINIYVPNPKAIIGASAGTFVAVNVAVENKYDTSLILLGTVLNRRKTALIKKAYSKILLLSSDSEIAHKAFEKIIKHKYSAYFIEKYLHAYKFKKELVDLYLIPGRKKVTGKSYIQLGVALMEFILEEELKNISQKTLLISGSSDIYVSPETAEAFLKKANNKNLSLSVIDKCGHNPSYEQPYMTAQAILEFLSNQPQKESKIASSLV